MRFFLTLIIAFQFISLPVLAQVGEVKSFDSRDYLKSIIAEHEAIRFDAKVRETVRMVQDGGANKYLKEKLAAYPKEDQETLKSWLAQSPVIDMKFKETSPGNWRGKIGNHVISFSLVELYEERILVDGQQIQLKGLSLAQLENKLTDIFQPKTSFYQILKNQIFIADAQALGPLLLIVVVGLLIAAIWSAVKVTGSSNENKSLDQIISGDLQKCQDSKYNKSSYNETYEKAMSIAENEAGLSMKGRFMKLLNSNEQDESTCLSVFETSAVVSNQYSDSQKTAICKNLEQLAECMNDFVQTHVKDETARTPKENFERFIKKGDKDFKRYKSSKQ